MYVCVCTYTCMTTWLYAQGPEHVWAASCIRATTIERSKDRGHRLPGPPLPGWSLLTVLRCT